MRKSLWLAVGTASAMVVTAQYVLLFVSPHDLMPGSLASGFGFLAGIGLYRGLH